MSKTIYVHMDLKRQTYKVGTLWVHSNARGESASFEYAPEWKKLDLSFSIEPALHMGEGVFHTTASKSLFHSIGDSAPDRWGRVLMERREAHQSKLEKRQPRLLRESDYLLMVNDYARQGALRFSTRPDGHFLSHEKDSAIPPLVQLGSLIKASERILARREIDADIRDLVAPGSSLGGARPKASVLGNQGELLIAKFPSPHDDWNVEAWEFLSFQLAQKAGLTVPRTSLTNVGSKRVLLLERFDRKDKTTRTPFLSAMSMLGYSDGDHGSYLELAEILAEHGAEPLHDSRELWQRMVFNILISNVDDHLRNHGFLYQGTTGWRLSPLYDLEPTPQHRKARVLHTRIDLYDGTASLEKAYSVADEFNLSFKEAKARARQVAEATRHWDKEAARLGINKAERDFMSTAFEHEDLTHALKS